MPPVRKFLIVDDNPDSRFLLVKTLLRKFPQSALQETHDANTAVAQAKGEKLDVVIVHRAVDVDGITLVRLIRHVNPTVAIVLVSGIDRTAEAKAAGATTFLNYDAWLRIGTVVADLLGHVESAQPFVTRNADPQKSSGALK
jgi:DNA-binding NarL/FixJ family response regulator